jgi:hypothetical protein
MNRLVIANNQIAAGGPFRDGAFGLPPLPEIAAAHGPSGRTYRTGFGKSGMSANEMTACFIGTFLGLVAAALLITILG